MGVVSLRAELMLTRNIAYSLISVATGWETLSLEPSVELYAHADLVETMGGLSDSVWMEVYDLAMEQSVQSSRRCSYGA